jgi:hypothetical protein
MIGDGGLGVRDAPSVERPVVPVAPDTNRHARPRTIEWVALAAALVPFGVAIVRAGVRHWMPMGDATYFTARSLDVFTSHWPLVGAWSSGSDALDELVNNLGPMQLDLLAPFTRVSPYVGTGVGTAVINAGCVALVWWSARKVLGPRPVVVVMAATLLLTATFGLSWLLDARQQFAMVLPFYALLWLATAMASGAGAAVPWALAVASLVVQTHFTYAYQGIVVAVFGVTAYAVDARRRRRPDVGRVALRSSAVLLVCWIQPLLDQVAGDGNLGRVLRSADSGRPGPGLGTGAQLLAGGALAPPFWLPGSIGDFLLPFDRISGVAAALTMVAWSAALAALTIAGAKLGCRAATLCGGAGLGALAAGLIAAARIPPSVFGLVPQNYYWVWAIGAFVTIVLVTGVASLPRSSVRWLPSRPLLPAAARVALPAVLVAACAVAVWPRYPVATVARDESAADRVGRPLRAELARAFASPTFPDTVEVDLTAGLFGNAYPFVVLTELQRAGVEFRYPPGNTNLYRFGSSRCAPAGTYPRVRLVAGDLLELPPDSVVLAEVAGFDASDRAELDELQAHFGEQLRAGNITVDTAEAAITSGTATGVERPSRSETGRGRTENPTGEGFVQRPTNRDTKARRNPQEGGKEQLSGRLSTPVGVANVTPSTGRGRTGIRPWPAIRIPLWVRR